jgi:DNA adenine methylase
VGAAIRPFLKWPGGKHRLVPRILKLLRPGRRLVEPFVGSGALFLSARYPHNLLADSNADLINLYRQLRDEGEPFVAYCRTFFDPAYNRAECYYAFRALFNTTADARLKSALFVYLNRHCYNGLCRYNASGAFNTPFGRYRAPAFPDKEMRHFYRRLHDTEIECADFRETMAAAIEGDTVYCDPPYTPLSATARFTDFAAGGFGWELQQELAGQARQLAQRGIQVVISNHDTPEIRSLYREAAISSFPVRRLISRDADNRNAVDEILAVFG